jgi:c-di-GMP-binding flagellar brake protein YcgR
MQERRRYKRFAVGIMEMNGKMTFARHVKILDISVGGVALKASRRLNLGNEYTLRIEYQERALTVKGTVIWSLIGESIKNSRGERIPVYTSGLKFRDISEEKIQEIIGFMKQYKENSAEKTGAMLSGFRRSVRVHIRTPEAAVLNFPENYRVKELSLGGMLIESEQKPDLESSIPMEMTFADDKTIYFWGRIASFNLVKEREIEHYKMGIEFLDMPEKDRDMLNKFVGLLDHIER